MKQSVAKFSINIEELEKKLNELIRTKEGEGKAITSKTARKDYPNIAQELLLSLLPIKLPMQIDPDTIKTQLVKIRQDLKKARDLRTDIASEEDIKNMALFKQKKAELKAIETLVEKLKKINEKVLSLPLIKDLPDNIEGYIDTVTKNRNTQADLESIDNIIRRWLDEVKKVIVSEYPLDFSKFDNEMTEIFSALPKETQENFKLLHAQHIVNLLNTEIQATLNANDETVQKLKNKEKILFQIETSELHHQIINAVSDFESKTYKEKVIDNAMTFILKEFKRGELLGAYKFRFPDDIKEDLKVLLGNNIDLLIKREQNEMALAYHEEKYKGYNELAHNLEKYHIRNKIEGTQYENLYAENLKAMEACLKVKQELNKKLDATLSNFIEKESENVHELLFGEIQKELGVMTQQEIEIIIKQAEQKTQLTWYDWLSSETFYSRCKKALIGATTVGATGGLAGTLAGLGIFSPVTGALGGTGGAVLGGIGGFMAPNIANAATEKIADLKKMTWDYIYGKENEVASEYFANASECTGLNAKYAPTERMSRLWGEDGAKIIACQYVNLLFELHIKLLYNKPEDKAEAELLELQYKHFYRNYQMLRGNEDEIRKLYKSETFGEDRARIQIAESIKLDCRQQVKEDLAAMLVILKREEKRNNNNHRKAINMIASQIDNLALTGDTPLLLQLESQIKQFPEVVSQSTLLLEAKKKAPVQELALVPSNEALALVEVNATDLLQQQMLTEIKQNSIVVANLKKKNQEIDSKYQKMNNLAKIANGDINMTNNMSKVNASFVENSKQYLANMNNTKAGEHLSNCEYDMFECWFENIFLNKYKNKDNVTRKDAISRKLFDNGKPCFEGKSIWHLLSEDTIMGKEMLSRMFSKQAAVNFEKFINYFDFEYKDNHNRNAIEYAATLSGPKNDAILKVYINELFKGYISGSKEQGLCDETFKKIIQAKVPNTPIYQIICAKLRDEIKLLWDAKQQEIAGTQSMAARTTQLMYYGIGLQSGQFDSTKVLSQLLASMAIYCTNHQNIPQSQASLIEFLTFFRKSSFVDQEVGDLLNDIDKMDKIAKSSMDVIKNQRKLYDFGINSPENIKNIITQLCTADPLPTPEEQDILIAMLSEESPQNLANFDKLINKKPYNSIVQTLLSKKFNDKNLIWLAVEANRPEIAAKLYNLSSNSAHMNEAGPNKSSAFTFAASKEDKSCFSVFCRELSNRRGLTQEAYMSRFLPNQADGRVVFHYLAEKGSLEQLYEFLGTGMRYAPSNRNWKKLTGMTVIPPVSFQDNEGNLPLHLLLKHKNANEIILNLNKSIEEHKFELSSIFDLFEIESLRILNNKNETSMELVMKDPALENALFKPFIKNAVKFSNYPEYRNNLFKCAEIALDFKNPKLFAEIVANIPKVHQHPKNVGYGYGTNPVTAQIDGLVEKCLNVLQNPNFDDDYKQTIMNEHLPTLLNLANTTKLKEEMEKMYKTPKTAENQTLMDMMFYTAEKKLTPDEKRKYQSYSVEKPIESFELEDLEGVKRQEPVVYQKEPPKPTTQEPATPDVSKKPKKFF